MRVSNIGLVVFGLALAVNLGAKDKAPKQVNFQGKVQAVDKNGSAFTIEKGNNRRQVVYAADTKFMYGHSKDNKPGAADQVKDGNFISCSGTYNDKTQLVAKLCIYRESK